MSGVPSTAVYVGGMALTQDGALYVESTFLSSTFATLPDVAASAGQIVRITDIGSAGFGSLWFSDGTMWKPVNGSVVIAGSGQGWILPGVSAATTASLTSNVVTVINGGAGPTAHNIPAATFDGYNVYFPGSPSIPAGWYPSFTRTSTTAYTFAFTHANVGSESVNGGAAYTSETTAVSYTLLANAMGLNGAVLFKSIHDWNNSGGAKTVKVKFGGTSVLALANTTTLSARYSGPEVINQNSASSQISAASGGGTAGSYSATTGAASQDVRTSINTAADVALLYTLQCAAATDFVTLGSYLIELKRP